MQIRRALIDIFGNAIQKDVAQRLTEFGLPTDQTKVSAWLRGRVPTIEQMNAIEDCYGLPHGKILADAGFIDVDGLTALTSVVKPISTRRTAKNKANFTIVGAGGTGSSLAAAEGEDQRTPKSEKQAGNRPEPNIEPEGP